MLGKMTCLCLRQAFTKFVPRVFKKGIPRTLNQVYHLLSLFSLVKEKKEGSLVPVPESIRPRHEQKKRQYENEVPTVWEVEA